MVRYGNAYAGNRNPVQVPANLYISKQAANASGQVIPPFIDKGAVSMKRTSAFFLRLTAVLLLVLALSAGAAQGESYEASTMRLLRHEGTVEIFDTSGEPRFLLDNVRFVSGESIRTGGDGQASVSLDDTKIVSMAADTRVEFIQESGHMQLNLTEGSLFLDVQKKLDENESFDIQTTTMTVGIRGTLIYGTQLPSGETTVGILEGGGRFTFMDTTGAKRVVDVSAGTKFVVPAAAVPEQGISPEISPLTAADLPEYVTDAVLADEVLTTRVINGSDNGSQLLDPSSGMLQAGISAEEPYPADGDWTWDGPVTLVAQSASKLYDGKPLMRPSDTLVYGLPGNFNISVTASGSLTNAGTCDNVVSSYSIYNASGENVTSHFTKIEKISGSLVVDPAPLVVWTGSAEKIYDGEPLTCSEAGIRTVPGHNPEAPAWINSSLVTQTALGSERMVALSGRTYVHGTNPLTSESQQLVLEAGQSLSVCLTGEGDDQSLEFRIENLKEEELPEEVLRVYADNPDLLVQACEDTGWDPDLMASLIAALPPAEETTVVSDTGLAVADADQENLMTDSTNVRIHIDSQITNYTTRALTEEEASFTPIVLDPSVVITATGSQTEVGESENTYTIDWGNANPKNYVVREDLGTLVVTPLLEDQVTIIGESASKVYDGTELTANRFTVSGLPEGYTVQAGVSGSVTDAGEAENKVTGYKILTADGEDYTAHFPNVRLVPGTLTVTPAPLTVTTGSAEKVYDGQPLTCDEAAITGFVNNETAAVTADGSITGSGTADNTYTISWDTAKESNYTVSEELGTLTVEALSVDVNCGGGTADYSGAAFVPKPVLTYLNGPHAGESVAAEPADISFSGSAGGPAGYIAAASGAPRRVRAAAGDLKYVFTLYTGDTLTLTLSGMGTDAGSFTLTGSVSSTSDSCSGISASLSGTSVTVEPAALTITSGSAEKAYDGTPLICEEYTVTGLADGQSVTITSAASLTDAGTVDNLFTVDWGELNKDNYTLTESCGTLTVKPAALVFDVGGTTARYSQNILPGPSLSYNGETISPDSLEARVGADRPKTYYAVFTLPGGDTAGLSIEGFNTWKGVGTYPLTAEAAITSGNTANYTISYENTSLVLEPAQLTVATATESKTYDGTPDPLTAEATLTGDCAEYLHAAAVGDGSADVGSHENGYEIDWSGMESSSDFFVITENLGTLTITPASLTVATGSAEKVYDGAPLVCEEYTVTGLADGQSVTVTPTASLTDVGTADNLFTVDWGELNKDNYTVTEVPGTLTVEPAVLVFDVGGTTARYSQAIEPEPSLSCNGETISPDSLKASVGADSPETYYAVFTLPGGDTAVLSIEGFNTWKGVGTYPLTAEAEITSGNAANYTISYENTSLVLAPAQLTVTTATESKTYDGTPDPLTAEATLTGDCAEYLHAAAVGDGSADAGSHENGYEIDWSGMESSSDFFIITENLGTLTIEPVDLTFDFHCGTVTYGRYMVTPPTMNGAEPAGDTEPYTYSLPVGSETVTLSAENLLGPDTDAGDYTIRYSCTFSGNSANYNVRDNGTEYTVSPWTISVQTPSVTKVYDGVPVDRSLVSYTGDDICDIRIYALGSQGSADAAEPYDNEYLIDWGSVPLDKQNNYDIQVTCGTLTINPVDITFDFHCGTVTYGRYTVTPPTMNGAAPANDTQPYTYDLPAGSETVTLSASNLLGPDTDAGDYTITYTCTFSGNSSNYVIHDNGTSYTVSPAQITIDTTAYSQSKTYDGDPFAVYNTPLPVADYPDIFYTLTEPDDVDVGTYEQDGEITDWGGEKASNFTVSKTTGTLEITPKDLTITTQFALKAYDGTPLTDNTSYIEGLVDGETITVTCKGSQTVPGSSLNDFDIAWVTAKEKNYNVIKQPEYLQVIKRPVTLRSASIEKTNFYGTLTNGDEPLTVVEGQFYGTDFEDLEVVFTASQTGDGSTSNTFEIVENEASSHYEITTEFGYLWIDNSNMSSEG